MTTNIEENNISLDQISLQSTEMLVDCVQLTTNGKDCTPLQRILLKE